MLHSVLFNKIKSCFLLLFAAFQRAMCCFRRRRRYSGEVEPLTHVVTAQNSSKAGGDMEGWNDWNFTNRKPQTVKDHIEIYRQQKQTLLQRQQSDECMQEENFFEDMTPKITKQKKLLLQNNDDGNNGLSLNSYSLQADSTMVISKDLGEWDENTGWEGESLDAEAMQLLREKKKQERERRLLEQQQKRMEKSIHRQSLGAKIS